MNRHELSRRRFLKTAALGGTVISLAPFKPFSLRADEAATAEPETTPTWADKPMRWAQLTW